MKVLIIGDVIIERQIFGKMESSDHSKTAPFVKEKTVEQLGGAAKIASICHANTDTTLWASVVMIAAPYKFRNLGTKTSDSVFETYVVDNNIVFRSETVVNDNVCIPINDIEGFDIILLSDFNWGMISDTQALNIIQGSKFPILVDARSNDLTWGKYTGALCIVSNKICFETNCGTFNLESARSALKKYKFKAVIVIDENFISFITHDSNFWFDLNLESGAEDVFIANFTSHFDAKDLIETLMAAKNEVELFGGHSIRPKLTQAMRSENKKSKETIVLTSGHFDILHPNHVNNLIKAKALGDRLIIALNSDASATRIKRKPINDQNIRKKMLELMPFVDEVIIFDEDTPGNVIKKVNPDVFVKGGDKCLEDINERKLLKDKKIVFIPNLMDNLNTTKIIKTIEERYQKKLDIRENKHSEG